MPTVLLAANPPRNKKRRKSAPKKRKPSTRKPQESRTVKKSRRRKSTPKARKSSKRRSSAGGFTAGRGGFLNVNLLIQGGIVGAGIVGTTILAPKIGAMAAGFTAGYSNTPVGQIVIKAGLGLGAYALLRKFAPKYATSAALGMIGSAAVDVYSMVNPGSFMRGTAPAVGAGTGVGGFFGPSGSGIGNNADTFMPYNVRMAA